MSKLINAVRNSRRDEPVSKDELLADFAGVFNALPGNALKGDNAPVEVFGMLLKSRKIAELFIPYWGKTKHLLDLTIREQELIILRSACYYGCDYVWGHHIPQAKEVGVSDDEIASLPYPPQEQPWSEKEKVMLLAVDSIISSANLSESLWEKLSQHWSTKQILDMITVVSQYVIFNSVNNIFGTRLENDSLPLLPDV